MTTAVDLYREALTALAAHRLRAALSAVGIVFGTATIVVAFAIGDGARRAAFEEIGALGVDNVFVRSVAPAAAADRKTAPAPVLTVDDGRAIAAAAGVTAVSGVRTAAAEIVRGGRHATSTLVGVTPAWSVIATPALVEGRWLTPRDVDEARRVTILGGALARQLFGDRRAVGEWVRAGGEWYEVVGVLAVSAGRPSAIVRIDPSASAIVPITAMDLRLGDGDTVRRVDEIAIASAGPETVVGVAAAVDALMARRHRDRTRWTLLVPRQLLDARLHAARVFNAVFVGVGGLALLISGIGIMNVMLASVADRVQEIGVRRAFGARIGDIVAQFAVEALLLAGGGGIVGIPVGIALAWVVAWLAAWPVAVSAWTVAVAVLLTVGVGLGFGVYPARVAARIQPIDALRAP